MAVVLTSIARVRDWQALERLSRETLVGRAREVGATRYRLYRNARDASRVLVVAEFPDHEAARELGRDVGEQLGAVLAGGAPDEQVWEATACAGFG